MRAVRAKTSPIHVRRHKLPPVFVSTIDSVSCIDTIPISKMGRGKKKVDHNQVVVEKKHRDPGQPKKVRYSWAEVLDPLTRVVALHPTKPMVAVAVGCIVRIHAYG